MLYPSLGYDLSHCTTFGVTLINRVEQLKDHHYPNLCPCIPCSCKSAVEQTLHKYRKTNDFVLQQAFAGNIIEWLRANHFYICQYQEKDGVYSIYLLKDERLAAPFIILYECSSEYTSIKLISLSYMKYSIKKPVTPLNTILQIQQSRQQAYQTPKETLRKSLSNDNNDMISLEELSEYYRNEIIYNYAVFHSLSSFHFWSSVSDISNLKGDSELYSLVVSLHQ